MIRKDTYEELKRNYGDVSSWAIWKDVGESPTSNIGDLSIFDEDNINEKLNSNYIFVGLNATSTHGLYEGQAWSAFHSRSGRAKDFKLRYALKDTPYWGAYITDLIKNFPEVNSSEVKKLLKSNENIILENIEKLKEEISIIGGQPVLIALGGDTYEYLNKLLANEYEIKEIEHHSCWGGKEMYRNKVLQGLK